VKKKTSPAAACLDERRIKKISFSPFDWLEGSSSLYIPKRFRIKNNHCVEQSFPLIPSHSLFDSF
jgi:hypothetical protein